MHAQEFNYSGATLSEVSIISMQHNTVEPLLVGSRYSERNKIYLHNPEWLGPSKNDLIREVFILQRLLLL